IIGFPFDTVDSIRRDLKFLMHEVCPDHASFFILMPLPGSMDHLNMLRRGEWMHPDFNLYDSQHELTHHPYLKDGSWKETYFEAWRTFYSFENMKAVLQRSPRVNYWNNFLRFIWYKNSIQTEGRHPMMCGYFRLKGRTARRPGFPVLSRWDYYTARFREVLGDLRSMLAVLAEMEELWLQTRYPSEACSLSWRRWRNSGSRPALPPKQNVVLWKKSPCCAKSMASSKLRISRQLTSAPRSTSPRSTCPPKSCSSGPSGIPCSSPVTCIRARTSTPTGKPSTCAGRNATSSVSP